MHRPCVNHTGFYRATREILCIHNENLDSMRVIRYRRLIIQKCRDVVISAVTRTLRRSCSIPHRCVGHPHCISCKILRESPLKEFAFLGSGPHLLVKFSHDM